MLPLSPLERKAAFAAAVTLRETNKTKAARDDLGVSWTHLEATFDGTREASAELQQRVADYCEIPLRRFWGAQTKTAA